MRSSRTFTILLSITTVLVLCSCYRPVSRYEPWQAPAGQSTAAPVEISSPTPIFQETPSKLVEQHTPTTPTPDPIRVLPTQRSEPLEYYVKPGDTLAKIALVHQVSVAQVIAENKLQNPDIIEVGQLLIIPPASANARGSGLKLIPDAELVYGPTAASFDVALVVTSVNGYLAGYTDVIDGQLFTGAEVVQRVADENSLNPRLLLAMLEYQSGWVTNPAPNESTLRYPMGRIDPWHQGLYSQMSWAANELNRGFYLWQRNLLAVWTLFDGSVVAIDPTINAGTAGLQYYLALFYGKQGWDQAVSEQGFVQVYRRLFGDPFAYSYEPLVPADLSQPAFILPFEAGSTWSFTSGPHGGWNDGTPWSALDFAPPGEPLGCSRTTHPVVAIAAGEVIRSGNGAVVIDLDGDGIEQTGWTVHYAHIDSQGRIEQGTRVNQGDTIGYPSCEGGFSTATHLHIARRYNGVWIAAFGDLPFVMDGWFAESAGIEYDGYLIKNEQTVEAWDGQFDINQIGR